MASESGFSNQLKKGTSQFKTIHSVGGNKFGQSVANKALYEKLATSTINSATDVDGLNGQIEFQIINMPGHGALIGDVLRIDAGDATNYEFDILEIVDADNFKILALVDSGLLSGVSASIMGWVTAKVNQDGSSIISTAPTAVAFNKDAVLTEVNLDTTVIANSAGLPVTTLNLDGSVFDPAAVFGALALEATQVSNGSNMISLLTSIDSAQSSIVGNTSDISLFTETLPDTISDDGGAQPPKGIVVMGHTGAGVVKHILVDANGIQSVNVNSSQLPTGAATAAKQDTGNTSLGSIDTKLTSQATAALQTTGNSSLSSIDTKLTSQATAAKQDAEAVLIGAVTETAPASDTASSGLNGRLQRIAQRLTSLIALLPTSLGQKTMANGLAVTLASDQSTLTTQSGYVAGTVSTAQITVGTSVVRATVAGTAPNAARKKLYIKPNAANLGSIYLGGSGVTIANGLQIIGPDRLEFEFDTGDYYLISDTAAQVVEILEKV